MGNRKIIRTLIRKRRIAEMTGNSPAYREAGRWINALFRMRNKSRHERIALMTVELGRVE